MKLTATPIPDGSHEIRIWRDEPQGEGDSGADIDAVCNLWHINDQRCLVTLAKGDLCDCANIMLGLKAMELGYRFLEFSVTEGARVSRHARMIRTADGFDYYEADLLSHPAART